MHIIPGKELEVILSLSVGMIFGVLVVAIALILFDRYGR